MFNHTITGLQTNRGQGTEKSLKEQVHGIDPVPAPVLGIGKTEEEGSRYSLVILCSFVTLDVELPPLQDLAALDAGDDHHQALHDALVQPLCKKPRQSLRERGAAAGTPRGHRREGPAAGPHLSSAPSRC